MLLLHMGHQLCHGTEIFPVSRFAKIADEIRSVKGSAHARTASAFLGSKATKDIHRDSPYQLATNRLALVIVLGQDNHCV